MIQRIKSLLLLVAVGLTSTAVSGQGSVDGDGGTSLSGGHNALRVAVPFLLIAPDSRASSLGDAGVATEPDINSQHWNPSKYAFLDNDMGVALTYTPWLRNLIHDIHLSYLAGYYRIDEFQVISSSLRFFSMGEITFTNDFGIATQHFNPNEFAFDMGYSRRFSEKISGGLAFRYIRSDLTGGTQEGSRAGNAFAADISTYYHTPLVIDDKDSELAIGANISNIGNKLSYDEITKDYIPINLRVGSRLTITMDEWNSIGVTLDLNKLLVPTPPVYDIENQDEIIAGMDPNVPVTIGMLQSFYDAPGGLSEELNEISYAGGLEYIYGGQFAVRAGYFDEHSTKGNRKYFTIGAGLKYNVLNFDFAYLVPRAGQSNPMANTVRFSLSFDFEPGGGRAVRR